VRTYVVGVYVVMCNSKKNTHYRTNYEQVNLNKNQLDTLNMRSTTLYIPPKIGTEGLCSQDFAK
jgi:hypothetical protein